MPCHATQHHAMPCLAMHSPCNAMLCRAHAIQALNPLACRCQSAPCHAHAMPIKSTHCCPAMHWPCACRAMPCHAMLPCIPSMAHHAMLCHARPCYLPSMAHHAMPCHATAPRPLTWLPLAPTECLLLQVRMQSAGRLPDGHPRKYPSSLAAYRTIISSGAYQQAFRMRFIDQRSCCIASACGCANDGSLATYRSSCGGPSARMGAL